MSISMPAGSLSVRPRCRQHESQRVEYSMTSIISESTVFREISHSIKNWVYSARHCIDRIAGHSICRAFHLYCFLSIRMGDGVMAEARRRRVGSVALAFGHRPSSFNRLCVLVGAVLAAMIVGHAVAQERPAPPPRQMMPRPEGQAPGSMMSEAPGAQMPGADPFQLLENSTEVQKDMGLTADQLARLNRASRNFRTRLQELSSPKPGVSPDQARAEIERHVMDTRGMIARELTPTQLARLQQIMLQLEGPCLAIIDQDVGEQLSLTARQKQAIGKACEARSLQMRQTFEPQSAERNFCTTMAANRDRVELIRSRADDEILKLLEPVQRAMFLRMSGKKIYLTPPMPPECN